MKSERVALFDRPDKQAVTSMPEGIQKVLKVKELFSGYEVIPAQ